MSDIENLSRPFSPLDIRPNNKTTKREPLTPGNTLLTWGTGAGNVFQLRAQSRGEVNNDDHKEIRRTFDTVRVKNPSDNSQFVDVEVLTEYQARNRIDDSRVKVRFTPQEASSNIEIMRRNQVRTTDPET